MRQLTKNNFRENPKSKGQERHQRLSYADADVPFVLNVLRKLKKYN